MFYEKNVFEKCTDPETFKKIKYYGTMTNLWETAVKEFPDEVAIQDNARKLSYTELNDAVCKFRTVLVNAGVKKGDAVGLFAPNTIEWVKAYLAITTLGCLAVLLPPHLPEQAIFGLSMKYDMKVVVYHPALQGKIDALNQMPHHIHLISAFETSEVNTSSTSLDVKDPCVIIFTGGTTGKSKGALLNNGAVTRGAVNGCYGVKDVFKQRLLLVLPLTHVFGLVRNLLTTLQTGGTLYICLNNKDMFKDIAMFRPNAMVMVPALAEMCLNLSKQFHKNMLGDSLKTIICGASTVPPYLVKEYKQYGITLLPGYGLTESANLVSGNYNSEYKPASVGFPYPLQDLKVVNGELWIKGDNVLTCYFKEEEETKNAFSEDGYFKTGDLVRFDDEGYLFIVGRIKEIIVLPTGEKVSPFDVENKFDELDIIQDSMVYLDETTNSLVVQVYPRLLELAKVESSDKEAYIREQVNKVNNELPSFMRVSKIIIRKEDFKRTPAMKIIRGQVNING